RFGRRRRGHRALLRARGRTRARPARGPTHLHSTAAAGGCTRGPRCGIERMGGERAPTGRHVGGTVGRVRFAATTPPAPAPVRPEPPPGPYVVAGLGRAGQAAVGALSRLAGPANVVAWER